MVPAGRTIARAGLTALSLFFSLSMSALGSADAGICQNQCQVGDGDLCANMIQVVPAGQPVILLVTKQRGTCGGGEAIPAAKLKLSWSREAKGPFSPIPITMKGGLETFTPEQPGPYFLSFEPRDGVGKRDQIVFLALSAEGTASAQAPVKVQFRLRPPRGMALSQIALKVTYVPDGVDDSFPSSRWPVFRGTDAPGASADPLSLPPGRYQLSWRYLHPKRPRYGIETVTVTKAGEVSVPLHPLTYPKK